MDKIISTNKYAYFDYTIHDKYEAGVKLLGWEVKSLRLYGVSLKNSFCLIREGEVLWVQAHLTSPLPHMHNENNNRILLLKKNQIKRITGILSSKHHTLIPLECYFKYGKYFKILLGICTKNTKYDKREKIKKRDMARNIFPNE